MRRRDFLSQLGWGLLSATALNGCGTLLHPERHGQPHSRDLDWKIVALDGLGLILFFVPGVIAFVVDFATGAIYLPPRGTEEIWIYPSSTQEPPLLPTTYKTDRPHSANSVVRSSLKRQTLARDRLNALHIEQIVGDHLGRRLSLKESNTRVSALAQLDHFPEQCRRHAGDESFGSDVRTVMGA